MTNQTDCIYVLDHGYVKVVESWGSDERIIEAARMSTSKGFLGWGPKAWRCNECGTYQAWIDPSDGNIQPCVGQQCTSSKGFDRIDGDEKLLRYLYENKHATPFEFAGLVVEVQAPIFVFREWHRHRTQSYNEMSARYTPLPDLNYIPTIERLLIKGGSNKQAASIGVELTEENARRFQKQLGEVYRHQQDIYENALAAGVPKELARIHLPVGRYSRMRASANLRNWLAFLTLRTASTAQFEIRQYAWGIGEIVKEKFPRAWQLFEETLTS